MEQQERKELQKIACQLRLDVLEQVYTAQSGHPGGALSSAELLTWLYWKELRVDPSEPKKADRDRFVLSKGHSSPGLYAALCRRGYFDPALLKEFRASGSVLQGHPDMKKCPGVDMTSGSLGQGVSAACGMALAAKLDGAPWRVYTLLGDGEIEEGQVWEAAMFSAHQKLDNLCWIVDCNGLQRTWPVLALWTRSSPASASPLSRRTAMTSTTWSGPLPPSGRSRGGPPSSWPGP